LTSAEQAEDGLKLVLQVKDDIAPKGQTQPVIVTAINTSGNDIRIIADSSAPVYMQLFRNTISGPEVIERFPEASLQVMRPWTLKAGESVEYEMPLEVKRNWPSIDLLTLQAHLNGRPDVLPAVQFQVVSE
jgi:hypothetical protein